MDLSIIIPVFNGEKYIAKCLDSILRIDNIKYEIIIVNDNSIDNTTLELEKYKNNGKIKIFNLDENRGVSYCRNVGLENARGEFVAFVDCDDYIEENMYVNLLNKAKEENADIVVSGFYRVFNTTKIADKYELTGALKREEAISKLLLMKISPAPWNKIYRKQIIKCQFNENLKVGEDFVFCIENFYYAKKIYVCKDKLYNYVMRANSAMHNSLENLSQVVDVEKHINKEIFDYLTEKYKDEFEFFKLRNLVRYQHSVSINITNKNRAEGKKLIKKYLTRKKMIAIIKNKYMSKSIKLETIIILLFGINIHLLLFPIYKKIKGFI